MLVLTASCSLFDKHVDVLLIGDSIMNQSVAQVKPQLRAQKGLEDISVQLAAVKGSGIMTPKVYDWQTEARQLVTTYKPTVVAVLFVGNYTDHDLFIGADGAEVPDDYSQKFFDEWGRQAETSTRTLQSTGSQVYWEKSAAVRGRRGQASLDDPARHLCEVGAEDARGRPDRRAPSARRCAGDFAWT